MNFKTREITKSKPNHKPDRHERCFIREQGLDMYNSLLKENPGIENDPGMFETLNKLHKLFELSNRRVDSNA